MLFYIMGRRHGAGADKLPVSGLIFTGVTIAPTGTRPINTIITISIA